MNHGTHILYTILIESNHTVNKFLDPSLVLGARVSVTDAISALKELAEWNHSKNHVSEAVNYCETYCVVCYTLPYSRETFLGSNLYLLI